MTAVGATEITRPLPATEARTVSRPWRSARSISARSKQPWTSAAWARTTALTDFESMKPGGGAAGDGRSAAKAAEEEEEEEEEEDVGEGDGGGGAGRDGAGSTAGDSGAGGADSGAGAGDEVVDAERVGLSTPVGWRRWRRLRARSAAELATRDVAVDRVGGDDPEDVVLGAAATFMIGGGASLGAATGGDGSAAGGATAGAVWVASAGVSPGVNAATSSVRRERPTKKTVMIAARVITAATSASFALDGPRGATTVPAGRPPAPRPTVMPAG
jgi:hypothetical protein